MADTGAALRIRTELRTDGVPATNDAVAAAAADPTADISALGIPLRTSELAALRASGMALDPATPIAYWVQAGETGRFGGLWIDPPGSGREVVAILSSDPGAMTLARCLEPDARTSYVAATTSLADLKALQDRISSEIGASGPGGAKVQSVGLTVRHSTMVVVVGVTGLTDEMRSQLTAKYGDGIVVEEQAPAVPA